MRQVEVSRTIVFDDPRRARGFFEALITDNIGIGHPERVNVVSDITDPAVREPSTRIRPGLSRRAPACTSIRFTHSRVKQYQSRVSAPF